MNRILKQEHILSRIEQLRHAMLEKAIDAYIMPSSDPHLSEYLPLHWQSRQWFSGFDGSAGILVVTQTFAGLWTDSRYWVQAEKQLQGTSIHLMKMTGSEPLAYMDWLAEHLEMKGVIALDGRLISLDSARQMEKKVGASNLVLRMDCDLVQKIWINRPQIPLSAVYEHEADKVALTRREKLALVRENVTGLNANAHFIVTLDDIAWLLNLRGSDIAFNPLFISYLLIEKNQATLFVHAGKISGALEKQLQADGITIEDYEAVTASLGRLAPETVLLLDPQRVTIGMVSVIERRHIPIVESINPTVLLKSRKAPKEIMHIRKAMEQDGAALCEFFSWLEMALKKGERITELDIAEKLESCRKTKKDYVSLSFDTIAGFNENGALPHYRATAGNFAEINRSGLLLIDSGAQYLGGTTDITRVVPIGEITDRQKRDYTLVLKGLIALSGTRFPRSVRAAMLDAIARAPLWNQGIDYGHGTGHGIGYFLNVHEGPQSISYHAMPNVHTRMEEGMITSIEPGIYREGEWGIRLENLVVNQMADKTAFGEFLCFETLTLCPFEPQCMEMALLTSEEIDWLNRYHEEVRTRLLPWLDEPARNWLLIRTKPLAYS